MSRLGAVGLAVTEWYVKVNLPPYLLSLDLHGEVDDVKSTALIGADCVVFNLVKVGRRGGPPRPSAPPRTPQRSGGRGCVPRRAPSRPPG